MENTNVSQIFEELASLLELGGHNAYALRAYRNFADTVRGLEEPLEAIWARGGARELPGVGKTIAAKIDELFRTGTLQALENARREVPPTLLDLLRVPGLGTKRIRALWHGLDITSLAELQYACRENRLVKLPGFGDKTQARVLEAVNFLLSSADFVVLGRALDIAAEITDILKGAGAKRAELAGEGRRAREQVSDIVVVVSGLDKDGAKAALEAAASVTEIDDIADDALCLVYEGKTKVRLRFATESGFLAALFFETGDSAHWEWLSEIAQKQGKDLAELSDRAEDEGEIYRTLDLQPVPPELREGIAPQVPAKLITHDALSGIFHAHTDWSDGTTTILGMAQATRAAGYRYIGISEHSQAAAYARGLSGERLERQAEAIAEARSQVPDVEILHGIEVDILRDGSLDLDDETLSRLDFVIASVHSSMNLPPDEMTARLVRAVSHPLVTMLGHPTGRLLLGRRGYAFDLDAVVEAAIENETYLEINCSRYRLDLNDASVRQAAKKGARFAINPDAHSPRGIDDASLGVLVARRAGLEAHQVLNAAPAEEVYAELSARKERALLRMGAS